MEMQDIRPLTREEFQLMQPELEAYVAGIAAAHRIQRMVALLGIPDAELDVGRLMLRGPAPAQEPELEETVRKIGT